MTSSRNVASQSGTTGKEVDRAGQFSDLVYTIQIGSNNLQQEMRIANKITCATNIGISIAQLVIVGQQKFGGS